MNNWKCPNCGVINNDQSMTACCVNCGYNKWIAMPTSNELPAVNYHRIVGEDVDPTPAEKGFTETCPDCARLKQEKCLKVLKQ